MDFGSSFWSNDSAAHRSTKGYRVHYHHQNHFPYHMISYDSGWFHLFHPFVDMCSYDEASLSNKIQFGGWKCLDVSKRDIYGISDGFEKNNGGDFQENEIFLYYLFIYLSIYLSFYIYIYFCIGVVSLVEVSLILK